MIPISLFMAWRYINKIRSEQTIATMIKISFLSIFIASSSLTLIISIMNGFEQVTYEKMQNIHPEIIMQSTNSFLNFNKISKVLQKEFGQIKYFAPSNIQYAVLNNDSINNDLSNVILIKGIDPIADPKVSNIEQKISYSISKDKKLENLLKDDQIIIGQKLSKELNINIGDKVTILVPERIELSKLNFKEYSVIISGLFNTGIDDFDNKVVICSLGLLSKLFPESGITQIGIKLKNNTDQETTINKLKIRFKVDVYSWQSLYPALVSSLTLEKYVAFFIFGLISLIASMNIIALLFMVITHKKRDLAILQSMGFASKSLKQIFIILGIFIISVSALSGLLFAFIIGIILQNYPFINLPDLYYSTYLPIKMELHVFITIFFILILIGLIASWIAVRRINYINIINILKSQN